MSSDKGVVVEEVSLDPDDDKATDIRLNDPCLPQDGQDPGPDVGSSQNSLSEDEVKTEDSSESDSEPKPQIIETEVGIFPNHGDQSVSSASDKGDCLPLVHDKVEETVQQPTNQMSQGAKSRSSFKSCTTKPWVGAQADRSRKGKPGKRLVDIKRTSMATLHHRKPKGGRVCRTKKKKKSTKCKKTVPEEIPEPPPDPDSESDEDNEMEVMRVIICFKNGRQIISGNAMDPEDRNTKMSIQPRGNFQHMTASLQMSAPRVPKFGMGKLGASCSNRKAAVFRGKEQSRPPYLGAATGGLWKASSKKKLAQEKKPLLDAPRVIGRRPIPLWGQRPKAAPVETSTFPPIACASTLENSKKHSTTPLEAIEPAHALSKKKAMARNTREALPVARGDRSLVCKDPGKNLTAMTPTPESYKSKEIPYAQSLHNIYSVKNFLCELPTHRAEQPCSCMHRGEMTSGDANTRAPQVSANAQLVALSQRGASPRTPALIGDQGPSLVPSLPAVEKQHQVPGTLRCPQCPLLEKEANKLRKQLATLRALNERFQAL